MNQDLISGILGIIGRHIERLAGVAIAPGAVYSGDTKPTGTNNEK